MGGRNGGGGGGGSRATPLLLSSSDEDIAAVAKRLRSAASGVKDDSSDGYDDHSHDVGSAVGRDGQSRLKKEVRALPMAGAAEGKEEGTAAVGSEKGGTGEAMLEVVGNGQMERRAPAGEQKSKIAVVLASEREPKAEMSTKRGRKKQKKSSKSAAADGLVKRATAAKSPRGTRPLLHGEEEHVAAEKAESESRERGSRRDAPQIGQTPASMGGSSTRRSSPRVRTPGQVKTDTWTSPTTPANTNLTKSHESHALGATGAAINDTAAPTAVSEMPLGEWRAEAVSRDESKAGVAAGARVVGGKELETKSADDDFVAAVDAAVDARVGGAGAGARTVGVDTRWVHVDPVQGAVDQAEKVSMLVVVVEVFVFLLSCIELIIVMMCVSRQRKAARTEEEAIDSIFH